MSDPLSITGSAVGVISLGLYLCGEIARYAQNVQGQTDDMQYLATKATNIRSLLKNLRELIDETRSDLPDVAEDLESKVLGLQVYLDKLKRPIEKYEQAQAATKRVRIRARSTLNKAIYHFKKEELFEVRDCLQSMEIDLTTALDV
jgi:predicted  nucleic acid-binding Zn-ribbon protein